MHSPRRELGDKYVRYLVMNKFIVKNITFSVCVCATFDGPRWESVIEASVHRVTCEENVCSECTFDGSRWD